MRFLLVVLLVVATTTAAPAQALRELPAEVPLPPEIATSLTGQLEESELLDFVRRWEGDVTGDGAPDQLVQAAMVSKDGGNAYWLRHFIFIGGDGGFPAFFPLTLEGGIISAAVDGPDLAITLSTYLDGDPRCCPSGTRVERIPLN